jgi:hypothetical protein
MIPYWPFVHFLVETLEKKVAGLDKSGIDLRFTIPNDENPLDRDCLKGESGRKDIRKVMHQARPKDPTQILPTDMDQTFRKLFQQWRENGQRLTTLLVFTDGIWQGTNDTIEQKIVDFLKTVQAKHQQNNHYFTIQFIRFGDNLEAKSRLQRYDDELWKNNGLEYAKPTYFVSLQLTNLLAM